MTEISRDVILDLLPLYLAGEASAATSVLIERYLETDPEMARTVKEAGATGSLGSVPIPISKEDSMEAYRKANKWMVIRTVGLAAIIAALFLSTLLIVPLIIMFLR